MSERGKKKWKHCRQFVQKKASGGYEKDKSNPSNQIASYSGSISVRLGLVLLHISHCRTTINHYRVRDYQSSACVSARYVSAGLLCLRGSTSVFFFPPWSCFGLKQLSVVVLPSRPPTQRAYSTGQMFWDCSLSGLSPFTSPAWLPSVTHLEYCVC